jgi:hypothetical protein
VTNTWDGSLNSDWYNGANWSLNTVPTSSHDVVIQGVTSNNYPEIAGLAICNSLTINFSTLSELTISTGTLTVNNDFNCYRQLIMTSSSGSLTVKGNLTFGSGAIATFTANATVNVWGNLAFQSGSSIGLNTGTFVMAGGTAHSYISVNQAGTMVGSFSVSKVQPYTATISSASTQPLTINGTMTVNGNFYHDYAGSTILKGDLNVQSGVAFALDSGTFSLEGSYNALINTPNTGNYFNHFNVNKASGYSATLLSDIWVKGSLTIQSGTFSAVYTSGGYFPHNIKLGGSWNNLVGPAAFTEGSGTVMLNGSGTQEMTTEDFAILVLNKPSGAMTINWATTVTCATYDWVAGEYTVGGGSFTANDLADPGIYGTIGLSAGTINYHQDVYTGSYVDLNGYLTISGGTFNIYGGVDPCVFGRGGAAALSMGNNGILDFHDVGIILTTSYSFTDVIGGGTIRTVGRFIGDRNDFNPWGGTLELYGGGNWEFRLGESSNLHNVTINKSSSSSIITGQNSIDINGEFRLLNGTLTAPPYLYVAGNWTNLAGQACFSEGTGTVTIDGSGTQIMTTETFAHLILNKSAGTMIIPTGSMVICSTFDWAAGAYTISGGGFVVSDLVDPGIYGTITLTSGHIEFFQNATQRIDLNANLTISGGNFYVHGGSTLANFSYDQIATLTLTGTGTLDFMDVGIVIPAAYQFNENISGGTLRTVGNFWVNRSNFHPMGGTVELYGGANTQISNIDGSSFHHLIINKANSFTGVSGSGPVYLTGNLTLQSGNLFTNSLLTVLNGGNTTLNSGSTLTLDMGSMSSTGHVTVNSGGTLWMEYDASLELAAGKILNVNGGGSLFVYGDSTHQPSISSLTTSGYYGFNINPGGFISARYAVFEGMDVYGINIANAALVDLSNAFHHCTIANGAPGGKLLTINNSQTIIVTGAVFPSNNWSGAYNVSKNIDQGSVYFIDASGGFMGEAYENDPTGRIFWPSGSGLCANLAINHIPATNSVQLDWDCVPNLEYRVYRASSPAGPFIETISIMFGVSHATWSEPVPGSLQFYRITAILP